MWVEIGNLNNLHCDKCRTELATYMWPEGEATMFACTSCKEELQNSLTGS